MCQAAFYPSIIELWSYGSELTNSFPRFLFEIYCDLLTSWNKKISALTHFFYPSQCVDFQRSMQHEDKMTKSVNFSFRFTADVVVCISMKKGPLEQQTPIK